MMQCPRCDSEIDRTVSYCPECGLDIESLRERMRKERSEGDEASASEGQSTSGADSASGQAGASSDSTPSGSGGTGERQSSDSGPFRSDDSGSASGSGRGASESGQREASGREPQPEDAGRQSDSGNGRAGNTAQSADTGNAGQSASDGHAQGGNAQRSGNHAQQAGRQGGQANRGGTNRQGTPGGTPQAGKGARGQHATQTESSLPLVQGAVRGAVAFALNFAAVFGLLVFEMSERSAQLSSGQLEAHQLAGWVFYNAHRVEIKSPLGSETFSYLENLYANPVSTTVPKLVFYAVPVIGLVLAGRTLAAKATAPGAPDAEKFKAGATVAVGYAALAVVGATTVFSVDLASLSFGLAQQQQGALKPELQSAVIFMGVVYPVVAGGIGGYLAD